MRRGRLRCYWVQYSAYESEGVVYAYFLTDVNIGLHKEVDKSEADVAALVILGSQTALTFLCITCLQYILYRNFCFEALSFRTGSPRTLKHKANVIYNAHKMNYALPFFVRNTYCSRSTLRRIDKNSTTKKGVSPNA